MTAVQITLKVTFAVWNLANSHASQNVSFIIYNMFNHVVQAVSNVIFLSRCAVADKILTDTVLWHYSSAVSELLV